jgi:alcohol dehydrogenase (NADP+)
MKLLIASLLAAGSALAQLNDIPAPGLGTWHQQDNGADVSEIIANAIQAGYRHIDCAWAYENQKAIGVGIKKGLNRTGIARKDLWITGKLWNNRYTGHSLQQPKPFSQ